MEIYEARLILNYGNNKVGNELVVYFSFKRNKHNDWIYQEDKKRYYRSEGWLLDESPTTIQVEINNCLCIGKAEQAFDHELTLKEQLELKGKMKSAILKALERKREMMLKNMNLQIDFLKNAEIESL